MILLFVNIAADILKFFYMFIIPKVEFYTRSTAFEQQTKPNRIYELRNFFFNTTVISRIYVKKLSMIYYMYVLAILRFKSPNNVPSEPKMLVINLLRAFEIL